MRRRALIIGCQTYGLTAVLKDVERVSAAMEGLGFEVDRCAGDLATRSNILSGFRRLIEVSGAEDAAFVYYSGHGAWSADEGEPGPVQFIVPVDLNESSEGDFRGIASPELSALMGELTSRTRNVTAVLDCCFASGMSRAAGPVLKALTTPPRMRVRPQLEQIRARGLPLGGPDVESNPHVVRLVASGIDQPAYEYTTQEGARTGILTDSFLVALREAQGLRVSWATLGHRVRERVMARFPEQRPEIEGPIRRALFETEEVQQEHALAFFRERGVHWLRGGRILGVNEGNEYLVMPLEALGAAPERALARAEVKVVSGGKSRIALDRPGSHIPEGAPAFLSSSTLPRRPVQVALDWGKHDEALGLAVRERIQASRHLRLAGEGALLVGRVQPDQGGLSVLDGEGDPVAPTLSAAPEGISEAIRRLEILAIAQAVRSVEDGAEGSFLEARLMLEWGRVVNGAPRALPASGALLREGERVYIRLYNPSEITLYASVFDVGVAGRIVLLNRSQPSGINLGPGRPEVLGMRPEGRREGLLLEWPQDVPRTGPRRESLVVVVSNAPQDLRALETDTLRSMPGGSSALERLVSQIATGGARAVVHRHELGDPVAYAVQRISFWLSAATSSRTPNGPGA